MDPGRTAAASTIHGTADGQETDSGATRDSDMSKIRIGRHVIETSKEDKVLWPDDGITKGDLVGYYQEIADAMVPHVKGRPLTMQRFPDGIGRSGFFQKDASEYFPDWIHTERLRKEKGSVDHVICDNAATLVYLANQAVITVHVGTNRVDRIDQPDRLVFDLDPPADEFKAARKIARMLCGVLAELELPGFVKTTGGKGLHVMVPLRRGPGFEDVRAFARNVGHLLEAREPEAVTMEARKAKRGGRLYFDIGRNAYGQHAVAPYSLRPFAGAPVSTPLHAEELSTGRLNPDRFTMKTVLDRVGTEGDPWERIQARACSLGRARTALGKLLDEV